MNRSFQRLKNDDFGKILQEIHDEIIAKYKLQNLREQAEKIQQTLRTVKLTISGMNKESTFACVNYVNSELIDIINDAYNMQVNAHSLAGEGKGIRTSVTDFFRNTNSKYEGKKGLVQGADDIFEEELAFLLQAVAKSKGISIDIPIILTGQSNATNSAIQTASQKIYKKFSSLAKEAIENYGKSVSKELIGTKISERTGKPDIKSPNFEIIGDAQDEISKMFKVFSNRTFSLKNYHTYNRDINQLSLFLGTTNLYKAITSPLSLIFKDPRQQRSVLYRGLEYLAGNTKGEDSTNIDIVNQHFSHLRFIYELRGQGLISTTTGQSQIADFIIWNDPSSIDIIVRSTADLILNQIDKKRNIFQSMRLQASEIIKY